MENEKLILGRIKDLSRRANENNYVTHTDFLSLSELSDITALCAREKLITGENEIDGVRYLVYGGMEDPDRAVMCFLPAYLEKEDFLFQKKQECNILSSILMEPANIKYADELTHRDYLGALMNMGIERNRIGDIRTNQKKAYVVVMSEVAGLICEELCRIKHTTVKCRIVPVTDCDIVPEYKEIEGTVSSERIDAILAFVFKLSRSKAQELVESEAVFIDGKTAHSAGYDLKSGSRVSVRGFGKFIYDGPSGQTRKGRLSVRVRLFV